MRPILLNANRHNVSQSELGDNPIAISIVDRLAAFQVALAATLFLSPSLAFAQQTPSRGDIQVSKSNSPWTQDQNTTATQGDAWFDNYRFRDGETLPRLRIHYATLGAPHRDVQGKIDNVVLVIHCTGADGNTLLSKNYMEALFAPVRPLDATRYFLIFPDNVGHGQSSKPSDGPRAAFPKYGYRGMVDLQRRLITENRNVDGKNERMAVGRSIVVSHCK
jgi:homoserine O-acetyltransferase